MASNKREELLRFNIEAGGDADLAALAGRLQELAKGSDTAAAQAQSLIGELEKLANTANNIRQFTTLKSSLVDTGEKLDAAKTKLAALGSEFDKADQPTQRLQKSLAKAATDVENLTKQQNRQQAELTRTSNALKAAGVDTDKLGGAYAELQSKMGGLAQRAGEAASGIGKAGDASKQAESNVSALGKAATASAEKLAGIATKLTAVGVAATTALAALAVHEGVELFGDAIRSAGTLEEALSQVRAVSGATAEEMDALKAAAEGATQTTNFTALEAAQGLGELARATGTAQAAIAALPATLNLAQAAGIGVAEAATFITTTLTQFGLGATEASRVADVLSKAANTTTADVQGLGNALSYAAPLAKQLGLDTEQTVAIIGALADQGFRGERAGTALRQVFSEMLDPASEFAKALRDIGIESSDFATVVEQLAQKGDLGREAILKLDAAARPAILSLVSTGGAGLRDLQAALESAGGSAAATAQTMGDNFTGAGKRMRASLDETRRSLVEPLLEPLADELQQLAGELQEFAASPEFEQIKEALRTLFVEGAKQAEDFLKTIDFKALAQSITDFASKSGPTLKEWGENIGTIVDAVKIVGDTFSVVFNGIQGVIEGVAAIVVQNINFIARAVDGMTAPARKILEFIGVLDEGQGSLETFIGGTQAVVDDFASRAVANFGEAANAVASFGEGVGSAGDAAAAGTTKAADASDKAAAASQGLAQAGQDAAKGMDAQADAAAAAAGKTDQAASATEAAAARIKQAFSDLGLQSQAELQRAADAAERNFDLIRQAVAKGQASAEDARRAFAAYAQTARAAVADSDASAKTRLDAELRVQAAILDTTGQFDLLGQAGSKAGDSIARSADGASSALRGTAHAASDAASSTDGYAESSRKAGNAAADSARGIQTQTIALAAMSRAATDALVGGNKLVVAQDLWRENFNRVTGEFLRQKSALEELNGQLDEQLAALDPLTAAVEALQRQYSFVDDATLRSIAEKQQRLDQQRQQAQADSDRARQDRQQAEEAQAQAAQATAAASPTAARPGTGTQAAAGNSTITVRLEAVGGGSSGNSLAGLDIDALAQRLVPLILAELGRGASVSIRGGGG